MARSDLANYSIVLFDILKWNAIKRIKQNNIEIIFVIFILILKNLKEYILNKFKEKNWI